MVGFRRHKLFSSNRHRSWTSDRPTEILRRTSADYSVQNSAVDSPYKYGLWLQKDSEDFIRRNGYERNDRSAAKRNCKVREIETSGEVYNSAASESKSGEKVAKRWTN